MADKTTLKVFAGASALLLLTGCEAFKPKTCVPGSAYAKEELLAFFADNAEEIDNDRQDIRNWSFDPRMGAVLSPEDIQLLDRVIETDPGWYAFAFTVPTIDGVEFSVLTGPNCSSEIHFDEPRGAQPAD